MKAIFLLSVTIICSINAFAVIDTLRHYDVKTANAGTFLFPAQYPKQIAVFNPTASGYIKSVLLTLGGYSSNGSVTIHIYGHEGGTGFPEFKKDLITPVVVTKTIVGIEKIQIVLPVPLQISNNLFFIQADNFSTGVMLLKDNITYSAFCSSASGGDYYYQYLENAQGKVFYNTNAFAIDVVMDYTEGLTSPRYLQDITTAAGIDTNLSNNCVAWSDMNNDHYLDLLVAGKLYKNNGNSTFTDITKKAALPDTAYITAFMDMNNDGKDDILYLGWAKGDNFIYTNNGDETFTKHTLNLSLLGSLPIQAISIADFNNDKYPDLFVGYLWTNDSVGDEIYYPHFLYLNNKNLDFTDTSSIILPDSIPDKTRGKGPYTIGRNRVVRGTQWVDYNDDGQMDLYVANYRLLLDELWKNNGDGTFTDVAEAKELDHDSLDGSGHGTGVDWADYDNDGDMDLLLPQLAHPQYVNQYDHRPTTIYQNSGAPNYDFTNQNPGANKGIGIEYEETHAGANWGDINNDGLLDFAICAFYGCRYSDIYIQNPDNTFQLKSFEYGINNVSAPSDLVLVDFDNDGKLDLACGDNGGTFRLFKNRVSFKNSYVELDFVSTSGNIKAVGAKVEVYAGGIMHTAAQMPYHGALMSKGNRVHFGLGNVSKIDSVVVRWPNGTLKTEKFTGVAINNFNILTEGGKVEVGIKEETKFLSSIQVYPNPATEEVTFQYELPSDASVTLNIYSMLGQKIIILNNELQTNGQHIVQWNMKGKVAAGLYSYHLQAGDFQKTGLVVVGEQETK